MSGEKSPQCAKCPLKPCTNDPEAKKPAFCPMVAYPEIVEESMKQYENEFIRNIHRSSTLIEKEGYGFWPRVREVVELCRRLNVRRIGVAFCVGLSDEASKLDKVFEAWGLDVYSVACKCGSIDKTRIGLKEEDKIEPGHYEPICNPILQAMVLNRVGTELNVVVGLCVGHDTIFMRFSKAPIVYLIAKDRATGHNPAAPLYSPHYFSKRILP
jgi:uncharacterized metal-binding protein